MNQRVVVVLVTLALLVASVTGDYAAGNGAPNNVIIWHRLNNTITDRNGIGAISLLVPSAKEGVVNPQLYVLPVTAPVSASLRTIHLAGIPFGPFCYICVGACIRSSVAGCLATWYGTRR